MGRSIALLAVLVVILAACSSDPTTTEEYLDLEQQLAKTEQSLADMTVERDQFADDDTERYVAALATQVAVEGILNDPESYGTEADVVALLATYATEDAVMDDAVFGAVPIENAWYYTLYGGAMDAEIDNYYRWLSDDGSQGGALWLWHGTNQAGNQFELPGISLDEYDENGLVSYEYVAYPYPADYVREAITGGGTAVALREESSGPPDEAFVFGEDDLCQWVTEEDVTEYAREAYEAVGVEWDGEAVLTNQRWVEEGAEYECQWSLSTLSGKGFEGVVHVETWPVPPPEETQFVAYEDMTTTFIRIGHTIVGHPEFADDVLVTNNAFGRYGIWVPTSDDQLVIAVNLGIEDESLDWEVPTFVIANGFLEKMNWTGG